MTLHHKILALTFDVVRRAICDATRCLPQTIIFELMASNFQHVFLNNTKRICEHLTLIRRNGFNTAQKVHELVGRPS